MLDKLKAYGFQALAMALLVLTVILVAKLYAAKLDVERARSALSAERESRAQENKDRMQAALDDARDTFRKGEIHARNQQEIADAHDAQEKRRVARLAAATADGERLRQQVTEFAATCGGGEAQSLAAALQHCRDRAATLGVLYREADSQAEAFAGAAEKHADEVRTLKRVIENDRALLPPPLPPELRPREVKEGHQKDDGHEDADPLEEVGRHQNRNDGGHRSPLLGRSLPGRVPDVDVGEEGEEEQDDAKAIATS